MSLYFALDCIGMRITRNKLQNKIQLLNANPRRLPCASCRHENPTTLHICVKKPEPKVLCRLFNIFCFAFFSYRAKSWACRRLIYMFIYTLLKIIEKSSRGLCVCREYVRGTWHSLAETRSLASSYFRCSFWNRKKTIGRSELARRTLAHRERLSDNI